MRVHAIAVFKVSKFVRWRDCPPLPSAPRPFPPPSPLVPLSPAALLSPVQPQPSLPAPLLVFSCFAAWFPRLAARASLAPLGSMAHWLGAARGPAWEWKTHGILRRCWAPPLLCDTSEVILEMPIHAQPKYGCFPGVEFLILFTFTLFFCC